MFGYRINVVGDLLTVTIIRTGKEDVIQKVDMSEVAIIEVINICTLRLVFIIKIKQENQLIM